MYTIPIVTFPSYRQDDPDDMTAIYRTLSVIFGVVITAFVSVAVFPVSALDSVQSSLVKSLRDIGTMLEKRFVCMQRYSAWHKSVHVPATFGLAFCVRFPLVSSREMRVVFPPRGRGKPCQTMRGAFFARRSG